MKWTIWKKLKVNNEVLAYKTFNKLLQIQMCQLCSVTLTFKNVNPIIENEYILILSPMKSLYAIVKNT